MSAGLIALSLAAAGFFALLLTPLFNVKTVVVRGNKTVSSEEIIKGSGIVEGTNIFGVSLSLVRDNLKKMNRVSDAKVKRVLPSTVSITVTEGAPVAYIYDDGDCVGITADGRVVDVTRAAAMPSAPPEAEDEPPKEDEAKDEKKADEAEDGEASDEEENSDEEASDKEETDAPEEEAAQPDTGLECALVTGMGKMKYKTGGKIQFEDETKAADLFKFIDEFLSDEVCRGVTSVDMSRYGAVSFVYKGTLKVSVGSAEELGYKLKCFKAILTEQLGEDPKGSLDLERLTYSPKNK